MKVVKAFEDTPKPPHRATLIGRIVGLPGSVIAAVVSGLARLHLAPDLDGDNGDDDLWLLLLASDPDGIWYPWPATGRRHQIDNTQDRR